MKTHLSKPWHSKSSSRSNWPSLCPALLLQGTSVLKASFCLILSWFKVASLSWPPFLSQDQFLWDILYLLCVVSILKTSIREWTKTCAISNWNKHLYIRHRWGGISGHQRETRFWRKFHNTFMCTQSLNTDKTSRIPTLTSHTQPGSFPCAICFFF